MEKCECGQGGERKKLMPRDEKEKDSLTNRLSRISGQIEGIKKMIASDCYCKDVLVQLEASMGALRQVEYLILKTHMKTCVKQQIQQGHDEVIDETFDLVKNLR